MTPTRAELEQLAHSPEGRMKRYELVNNDAHGGWATRTEMEPDPTGDWVKHEDAQAELTALREAVRVLGEECREWRRWGSAYHGNAWTGWDRTDLSGLKVSTNANPIALAAVEKAP